MFLGLFIFKTPLGGLGAANAVCFQRTAARSCAALNKLGAWPTRGACLVWAPAPLHAVEGEAVPTSEAPRPSHPTEEVEEHNHAGSELRDIN